MHTIFKFQAEERLMIARRWYSFFLFIVGAAAAWGEAAPYYQRDFPPEEFKARWEMVFNKIGSQAVAGVERGPPNNRLFFFRQNKEIFLFSGGEKPGADLLVRGRARKNPV